MKRYLLPLGVFGALLIKRLH